MNYLKTLNTSISKNITKFSNKSTIKYLTYAVVISYIVVLNIYIPVEILQLYDSKLFNIGLLVALCYIVQKDITLGILLSIAYLITHNMSHYHKLSKEGFINITSVAEEEDGGVEEIVEIQEEEMEEPDEPEEDEEDSDSDDSDDSEDDEDLTGYFEKFSGNKPDSLKDNFKSLHDAIHQFDQFTKK